MAKVKAGPPFISGEFPDVAMAEKCAGGAAAKNGAILGVANGGGLAFGAMFIFVASFLQIGRARRGVAEGVARFYIGRAAGLSL